jgi:hypothetical protein
LFCFVASKVLRFVLHFKEGRLKNVTFNISALPAFYSVRQIRQIGPAHLISTLFFTGWIVSLLRCFYDVFTTFKNPVSRIFHEIKQPIANRFNQAFLGIKTFAFDCMRVWGGRRCAGEAAQRRQAPLP